MCSASCETLFRLINKRGMGWKRRAHRQSWEQRKGFFHLSRELRASSRALIFLGEKHTLEILEIMIISPSRVFSCRWRMFNKRGERARRWEISTPPLLSSSSNLCTKKGLICCSLLETNFNLNLCSNAWRAFQFFFALVYGECRAAAAASKEKYEKLNTQQPAASRVLENSRARRKLSLNLFIFYFIFHTRSLSAAAAGRGQSEKLYMRCVKSPFVVLSKSFSQLTIGNYDLRFQ